jgi:hypothetical protein
MRPTSRYVDCGSAIAASGRPIGNAAALPRGFERKPELGVLRTASVNISRSSAFVLWGCRALDFCHFAIHLIW